MSGLTPAGIVLYHLHCQVAGCRYEYVIDREDGAENEPFDVVPYERSYEECDVVVSHGLCREHFDEHYDGGCDFR
jgi:hypothetical protein